MIAQMLESIAAAEEKAKEMIENAEKEAKEIAVSALSQTETLRAECGSLIKNEVKTILNDAEAQAAVLVADINKKAAAEVESFIKACDKNMQKSVEYAFDHLMKSINGVK